MINGSSWRAKILSINVVFLATIACPIALAVTASSQSESITPSAQRNASNALNAMSDAFTRYVEFSKISPLHGSMGQLSNEPSSSKVLLGIVQYHRLKVVTLALDTCSSSVINKMNVTSDYPDKALPPDAYMKKLYELNALCFDLEPSA